MSRYAMCPICGHRMAKISKDTYYCRWCSARNNLIFDEYEDDDEETISVYDAADIWASNGKDEDYMFGYTAEELENAL